MKKSIWIILLLALPFASCNRNKIFEKYHKFENFGWKRIDSSIFFEVPVEDTDCNYDVALAIRYIDGIRLKSINTGITIYMPDSAEYYNEYTIRLINDNGSYIGSVAGDIWDLSEKVIKNMPFSKAGTYKFEIQNLTGNKFVTGGIMEIGLIVEKAEM